MAKSGITETMTLACVTATGTIALQFFQGGIMNESNEALTVVLTAAVPLVLRITGKQREREESSKGII